MRLLLATDGSPDATTALTSAGRLLRPEALEADLLCVAPEYRAARMGGQDHFGRSYDERMAQEADRLLALGVQTLLAEGVTARPIVDRGSPGDVILGRSADYDVTVIGAHDRFGRTQPGVGPVASQVIAHCASALLVGRELTGAAPPRVLFCADGSAASERALTAMLEWVRLDDAEVDVMHVIEMPWLRLGLDQAWLDDADGDAAAPDTIETEFRRRAQDIVNEVRGELERRGVASTPVLNEGIPELQILSQADVGEYDLIVVGATGQTDVKHAMLGSVSIRVAQNAPASVLVV